MWFHAPALIAFSLAIAAARPGFASCGDRPGDVQAVADARADAAAECDCTAAASHTGYVDCVARVASAAARAGRLRSHCRTPVVRCAVRSTCGRPGSVTCCRTRADGTRRCSVMSSAALCTAPSGGSACVGSEPSCCDACGAGSCTPPTTTTTTPPPGCGSDLDCDDGNGCTDDRCVDGKCQHQCLCVAPDGSASCCPGPAAQCPSPSWFYTCGDPVCGGHRDHPDVPMCGGGETPGASCAPEGVSCDPGDLCNRLLVCAPSDPTHGGLCPISRRRAKEHIRYLGEQDVKRLHDELMRFRLATFRYRGNASRTQLGFIIDDMEPSLSVDPVRDMVDLYAYTSMAVAALQTQAREIEALRNEVETLRRGLKRRPAR